jgi:hypothetical protein
LSILAYTCSLIDELGITINSRTITMTPEETQKKEAHEAAQKAAETTTEKKV